jgi:multisubunit Na+/H+ antiporter MnhG subunit
VIVEVLIALGVASELMCCVGLMAMRNAIERLHYANAATVSGPVFVAAAICVEKGLFTTDGLNAVGVAVMLALLGSALAIATARAIRLRERGTLASSEAERERSS